MSTATPGTSPAAPFSQEAERLGDDLARFLAVVPAAERGAALARVLTKVFGSVPQPPQPQPDSVPDELLEGFQDNFPAKQVFPQAFLDWARANFNMEELRADLKEVEQTGGIRFEDFYPELEKLVTSHG